MSKQASSMPQGIVDAAGVEGFEDLPDAALEGVAGGAKKKLWDDLWKPALQYDWQLVKGWVTGKKG